MLLEQLKIISLFLGLLTSPSLISSIINNKKSDKTYFKRIFIWSGSWTIVLYFYFFSFL